MRVPFVVRGPGVPAGTVTDALLSFVDVGPTLLALAGAAWASPWPADGVSLAPTLASPGRAPPPGWRDRTLSSFTGWSGYEYLRPCDYALLPAAECAGNATVANVSGLINAQSNTWVGLRIRNATAALSYAEFRPQGTPVDRASTNWTELYDLDSDPHEMVNVAATSPLARALSDELWAVATCVGAACP